MPTYDTVALPKRPLPDGRSLKIGKIGRCRQRFKLLCGRPTTFCRGTQVKSYVNQSADFQGFSYRWSIEWCSPDNQMTIDRHFEEIYIQISADSCPIIGLQWADDRQTVGGWHIIKEMSAYRRRISAVILPMITRMSTDHKLWIVLNCL